MEHHRLTSAKGKPRRLPTNCCICSMPALYAYYGAVVCHSCKVFFRRNAASAQKSLRCRFDGHCPVNIDTRHVCTACRLEKCLRAGMQIDLIRGSRGNQPVYSKQITKPTTLNLVDKDLSSLTASQWMILNNLSNSYDPIAVLAFADAIKKSSSLVSTTRDPIAVQDLLTSFYNAAGAYLRMNSDIQRLLYEDRSILLHTAADNATCLGGVFLLHHTHLYDDEVLCKQLQFIYGRTTMAYHRWAGRFNLPDVVLFKLALALFSLSTNSRTFHPSLTAEYTDPQAILAIESHYAELIWRYLVYKYHEDQAVRIFVKLTEWLLALTLFMSHAHNAQPHVEDINSLIEKIEITLILDDVDRLV